MISSLTSDLIGAVLVLGVVIVIHELGHFLVAKLFRIKVETFSVGFGPRILGFRRGETDYRLSAFPLGGYVKMAGENVTDEVTGAANEFLSKPKWQRFLVAAAGPFMNVVLAVGLLAGMYMYGTRVPEFMNGEAVVGTVEAGSPAEKAGILSGDRIVDLDGKKSPSWQDIGTQILIGANRNIPLTLNRNGQIIQTSILPVKKGQEEMGDAGMGPIVPGLIRGFQDGSPAAAAGMELGDRITTINGIDLQKTDSPIQDVIQSIPDKTLHIVADRKGEAKEFEVTPNVQQGRRMIGIVLVPTVMIKLGFVDAISQSVRSNAQSASLLLQVFGRLFKREASMKAFSGPIGIVRVSGQAFDEGFVSLILLMAAISLNLGLINLLPVPILDGGVMLLLFVETLMGRDLSVRVKERIVQVSFVFLLTFMVLVIYNDVVKLLPASTPTP